MQLLRERDVPGNEYDRVFRYSRLNASVVYTLLLGGTLALFAAGVRGRVLPLELIALAFAAFLSLS